MKKSLLITNLMLIFVFITSNIIFIMWRTSLLSEKVIGEFQTQDVIDSIQVVNTGTSHGSVSFDWKSNNRINGLNLGRSGQPLFWDNYLLNFYSNSVNDSLILVPISFHTFCMSDEYTPLEAIYESQIPLLGIVSTQQAIDLVRRANTDNPFPNDTFNFRGFSSNSIEPRSCSAEDVSRNVEHIKRIIDSFDKVVLLTTPLYIPSLKDLEYFDDFYNVIDSIVDSKKVDYFDYSRDNRFNSSDYFYNSTHLNTSGREKFTNIVIDEIVASYFS